MKKNDTGKLSQSLERVIGEMKVELDRSFRDLKLPHHDDIRPLYMSYCFETGEEVYVFSDLGSSGSKQTGSASLETELRVGKPGSRTIGMGYDVKKFFEDPGEGSTCVALWRMTDDTFKDAVRDYLAETRSQLRTPKGRQEKRLKFHVDKPVLYLEQEPGLEISEERWKKTLEKCTDIFKSDIWLVDSEIEFSASRNTRCFLNSEGSVIVDGSRFYSICMSADALSVSDNKKFDGQPVSVQRQLYFSSKEDIPSEHELASIAKELLSELHEVMESPVQEPADIPVMMDPELSAHMIYAIVANSIVNRCYDLTQIDRNAYRRGDELFPDFISIEDNPGLESYMQHDGVEKMLNGHTLYDDQGVPAEHVWLVRDGKVDSFPCSRSYVSKVAMPNGRGHMGGGDISLGITNMFVHSEKTACKSLLVDQLLDACDENGNDYGLMLVGAYDSDIDSEENFYTMTPRLAYRVWAKDMQDPDTGKMFKRGDLQMVRGVEVVGNPELTLGNMVCTGDDYEVTVPIGVDSVPGLYNGEDSSVICPSILLNRAELKKEFTGKTRQCILPHPLYNRDKGGGSNNDD